jgi:low temperature requirement protein LtrA
VASVVVGVHDTDWAPASVLVAAVGFVAVAALWWLYFDLGGAAGKRNLIDEGDDQESGVADAYVYGHLPLMLGLVVVAVGIEQFIMHPGDDLSAAARWALHGGTTLVLVGTAAEVSGTAGSWRAAWPWPAIAIPAIAAIGATLRLTPAATIGLSAAVLVSTVLAGIRQQRRGRLDTTET